MTPLAQRIVKRMTLPTRQREALVGYDVAPVILQAHCFDVTDVIDMLAELSVRFLNDSWE